jgi:hypothetical protein
MYETTAFAHLAQDLENQLSEELRKYIELERQVGRVTPHLCAMLNIIAACILYW